jgi:hypothetical protein
MDAVGRESPINGNARMFGVVFFVAGASWLGLVVEWHCLSALSRVALTHTPLLFTLQIRARWPQCVRRTMSLQIMKATTRKLDDIVKLDLLKGTYFDLITILTKTYFLCDGR